MSDRPLPPSSEPERPPEPPEDERSRWERALGARWVPRARMPGVIRRRLPQLPPEAQYRLDRVMEISRGVLGLLLLFGSITLILMLLFRTSVFEPRNARAVFQAVQTPRDTSYSIETVRQVVLDGALLRQDTITGAQVDFQRKSFRLLANGYTGRQIRMAGDGQVAVVREGSEAVRVFGCSGKACDRFRSLRYTGRQVRPYPAFRTFQPVTGQDLARVAGRLQTNTATVYGQRGWQASFRPTPTLLLRMLQADLLALDSRDIQAIRAGRYRVIYANATVTRSSRLLHQIDVLLQIGRVYLHILVTYRRYDSGLLRGFRLDQKG